MVRKKYIVLGGNGFIGRNLCTYLADLGIEVASFDRDAVTDGDSRVQFIQGDFFEDEFLRELIYDYDVIFHAISTINPGNSNDVYMNGYGKDLVQTIKLCSWIKDTNKSMVFLSSGGTVYGNQMQQPITEQMLPLPINHYGNIKLCIENALRIFHIQNTMNIRIARIANPYGPGQDYTKGVGFVDAVLKRAMEHRSVEVWGDGETVRDYIYIKDVCYYLHRLAEYEGSESIFNISSGKGLSQNQIIQYIRELGMDVQVEYKATRSVDVRKMILDNQKIRSVCGTRLTPFESGVESYYRYLKLHTQATNI